MICEQHVWVWPSCDLEEMATYTGTCWHHDWLSASLLTQSCRLSALAQAWNLLGWVCFGEDGSSIFLHKILLFWFPVKNIYILIQIELNKKTISSINALTEVHSRVTSAISHTLATHCLQWTKLPSKNHPHRTKSTCCLALAVMNGNPAWRTLLDIAMSGSCYNPSVVVVVNFIFIVYSQCVRERELSVCRSEAR